MIETPTRFGPHRNHGARLREFTWQGRRCISFENEILRMVVAADKGCDILELTHKPSDTETLHQAPAGMLSPMALSPAPLEGGPYRDQFAGGWFLMLPNGPEPCTYRGARYGHHGEATLLAWDYSIEEDRAARVSVLFRVRLRRTPLLVERRISLSAGSPTVSIDEAITNEAPQDLEVLWGHHPTFGTPLIGPGTRVDLPPSRTRTGAERPPAATLEGGIVGEWPRAGDVDLSVIPDDLGNAQDFVRIDAFQTGWFAIRNPHRKAGIAFRWDERLFPVLGYWRLLGGGADYPWYGARTMLALEPCSDLPSVADSAARGTAVALAAGERRETQIVATLFEAGEAQVTAMDRSGTLIFAGASDAA